MQFVNLVIDIGLQFIIILVGFIEIKRLNVFEKFLWLQILISVINYGSGKLLIHYFGYSQNTFQYNIYFLIEIFIILYATYQFLRNKGVKKLFLIGMTVILVAYFTEIALTGINVFANYSFAFYSMFIATIFLYILYQVTNPRREEQNAKAILFISLGIVLFFLCNAPYMAMMNYLQKINPVLNAQLFHIITDVLSNIRYFLFLVGLVMIIRNKPIVQNG